MATLTGENGILTKANDAKTENVRGVEKEQIALAYNAVRTDKLSKGDSSKITKEEIQKELKANGITIEAEKISQDEEGIISVEMPGGNKYTMTQTGVITYVGQSTGETENEDTITAEDYGTEVSNYTAGNMAWEILYADEENVYLITKGHLTSQTLSTSGYNGTSDIVTDLAKAESERQFPAAEKWLTGITNAINNDSYSNSNDNMKATEYLLDKNIWSTYADSNYADYAIGGPTLELLSASFKASGMNEIICTVKGNGYNGFNPYNGIASDTVWNRGTNYWIAAPSRDLHAIGYDLALISSSGSTSCASYTYSECAFRPVVCLKSNVKLTLNKETGKYTISLAQQ